MTWDFGTITSATPATQLGTKIAAAMTDSGHYAEVDDYTLSGDRYRVYRNAGEGFFVILKHASGGTGAVSAGLCETYNSTAHTAGYVATSTGYVKSDYGLSPINTAPYPIDGWPLNNGPQYPGSAGTNTTGFTFLVSASSKRVCFATLVGQTSSSIVYNGAFEPFVQSIVGSGPAGWTGADPGPFVSGVIGGGAVARYTRHPYPGAVGTYRTINSNGLGNFTTVSGTPGSYNAVVDGILVSRPQAYTADLPYPRGLLYGAILMESSSNYAFGDELTVNGSAKYKVVTTAHAVEML